MNFINGLMALLVFQLIGEVAVRLLSVPVPGPVVGMVLLLTVLLVRRSVTESIDSVGTALLSHLSLLFVPAGVGMMVHFDRIADEWVPILVTLVVSTLVTMAVTALVMQLMLRLMSKGAVKANVSDGKPGIQGKGE